MRTSFVIFIVFALTGFTLSVEDSTTEEVKIIASKPPFEHLPKNQVDEGETVEVEVEGEESNDEVLENISASSQKAKFKNTKIPASRIDQYIKAEPINSAPFSKNLKKLVAKDAPGKEIEIEGSDEISETPLPAKKIQTTISPSFSKEDSTTEVDSVPEVLSQPLSINELAFSLQMVPSKSIKRALKLLRKLHKIFKPFPVIQSYFDSISEFLDNKYLIGGILNAGNGMSFLSSLSLIIPVTEAITELNDLSIETDGNIIQMAGIVESPYYENIKYGNDLIKKHAKFYKRVPILGDLVEPFEDVTNNIMDVRHALRYGTTQNKRSEISDIGKHLRKMI